MNTTYQPGFFDKENKLLRLTQLKDPLVKLDNCIDWEQFRPILDACSPSKEVNKGGRPGFDKVMMFKLLILQQLFGISDDSLEFQITDRFSFMRFAGLNETNKIPDSKTIWHFRNTLTANGTIERLFEHLAAILEKSGLILKTGSIIDASIVKAPIQRNPREENKQIKETEKKPDNWSAPKARQKDIDASWTMKHNTKYFGYKNHLKVDIKSKLITEFDVTPANVHDSDMFEHLINSEDAGKEIYADSAYVGKRIEKIIRKYKLKTKIQKKGYRNRPLTTRQLKANRIKSKIRSRVEHVFGTLKNFKSEMKVKCIGLMRAVGIIGLQNILYNLTRTTHIIKVTGKSLSY